MRRVSAPQSEPTVVARYRRKPPKDHGLPRCATCAHARVIPDVRPIEWRCRGGRPAGGLVYRGESGALTQYLTTPRKCPGYVRMG